MHKLQLPQAKLLWAVSETYRKRKIDENEKRLLKEKIITDNIEIFQALNDNPDEEELIDKLVSLVRVPQAPVDVPQKDAQAIAATEQQDPSSPWGQFLRRKKMGRKQQNKNEAKVLMGIQRTE